MSLQERLDAISSGFAAQAPQEVLDVMHRAVEDLRSSGILEGVMDVGDRAPEFALADTTGGQVSLSALLERGPLWITFYRGRW